MLHKHPLILNQAFIIVNPEAHSRILNRFLTRRLADFCFSQRMWTDMSHVVSIDGTFTRDLRLSTMTNALLWVICLFLSTSSLAWFIQVPYHCLQNNRLIDQAFDKTIVWFLFVSVNVSQYFKCRSHWSDIYMWSNTVHIDKRPFMLNKHPFMLI